MPEASTKSASVVRSHSHVVDSIVWPVYVVSPPAVLEPGAKVILKAIKFIAEPGNFKCDHYIMDYIKRGGDTFYYQDGAATGLTKEVRKFLECRMYALSSKFEQRFCPVEFRPFKEQLKESVWKKETLESLVSIVGLNLDSETEENLKKKAKYFLYNYLNRKGGSKSFHTHHLDDTEETSESEFNSDEELDNNRNDSPSDDNAHQEVIQSILTVSGASLDLKTITNESLFSLLPKYFNRLGDLALSKGWPLVVQTASYPEAGGSNATVYTGDFLESVNCGGKNCYHGRCIDDIQRYFKRYIEDQIQNNAQKEELKQENIIHEIIDDESSESGSMNLIEPLHLTANENFTAVNEDKETIITELDGYLLRTYRLRSRCEDSDEIPWNKIVDDMTAGGEKFVETARLPKVDFRSLRLPMILNSPEALPLDHLIALVLHILKGDANKLESKEIFCWRDVIDVADLNSSEKCTPGKEPEPHGLDRAYASRGSKSASLPKGKPKGLLGDGSDDDGLVRVTKERTDVGGLATIEKKAKATPSAKRKSLPANAGDSTEPTSISLRSQSTKKSEKDAKPTLQAKRHRI